MHDHAGAMVGEYYKMATALGFRKRQQGGRRREVK
jgi:hypothetical protein